MCVANVASSAIFDDNGKSAKIFHSSREECPCKRFTLLTFSLLSLFSLFSFVHFPGKVMACKVTAMCEPQKFNKIANLPINLSLQIGVINISVAITIDEMVEMGLHFGHQAKKWNPKMAPYIYTKRNGVHIIDLIQTCFHIKQASEFLTDCAAKGKTVLFVGTKKQAAGLVAKAAIQSSSFYVNQRWLGGMLTNWETMKSSIAKLNELELREKTDGFKQLPKKEAALCKKQKERLQKYLGGVKEMRQVPDVVIIIGQPEEMNAVLECKKLGIRSVTVLDTNCDPTVADLFVPANDDSVTSLKFLLKTFLDAIVKGQSLNTARNDRIR